MTYIAIDLWDKRCWIAISRQGIAFPKDIVKRTELISWLKKFFKNSENISHIIVWLPYDLYGMDTKQLDKTTSFIRKLQWIFPEIMVIWHDERFSSFQASELLQSYLDCINSNP